VGSGIGRLGDALVKRLNPILLTGTVIPLLAAAPAFGQTPTYTWTGFYIGANVGAVSTRGDFSEDPAGVPWWTDTGSTRASGLIGGFQVGYNWQAGDIVYGLEADASLADADKTVEVGAGGSHRVGLEGLASIRGRIGFAADRTQIYATGGAAYGRLRQGVEDPGPNLSAYRGSDWGWIAGGGIEQAFAGNWTARVEVLHARFGAETVPSSGYVFRLRDSATIARFAINYRY
jgi:outer membrane immunogenic protein